MDIVDAVREIIEQKTKNGVHPTHAMILEVIALSSLSPEETKNRLRDAIQDGSLGYGETINSIYFVINNSH